MKNKYLKVIILVLIVILMILAYILYDLLYAGSSDNSPKEKGTFKATTTEGKLREISSQIK